MKLLIKLYIVFTALVAVPMSYAQYDLNGNGTIDLPLTLVDGEQLRWFGQDLTTDEVFQMGLFGHPDYQVGIGHWISTDKVNRVYVRKTPYGEFQLFNDETDFSYPLGISHDSATVIINRDIDSSGLLDAALINGERSKWAWKLSFDPLSGNAKKRRVLYGSKRHTPFLFRARGQSDSLGLLKIRGKRSKISYRALKGRRKRKIRLRGFTPPKEQPVLIRGSNGRDNFGFSQNQRFLTISSRGRKDAVDTAIPEGGLVLVGNFDSTSDDEIITFAEGKIIFTDGETKRLSDENVKPLFNGQSGSYEESDISPTIVPTKTPTVTPVPTGSPTSIPTNTVTPTYTSTAIPTWTLQPTYTAVPTFTATPTPTITEIPDTVAPVVSVNTQTTTDNTPDITGTVNDPNAIIRVLVNGRNILATNNGDGTWILPGTAFSPPLTDNTYELTIVATDDSGNAGYDMTTNELTIDVTAPILTSSTPADNQVSAPLFAPLTLTFNEPIIKGTGNITLSNGSTDVRTISISDSKVTVSGTTLSVALDARLLSTSYHVLLEYGAITDTLGNKSLGITEPTDLNFITRTNAITHIDNDDQGGQARGVWGDGNFLYLANRENGLEVYSVSETGQLTHIDNDDQGGAAYGVWGDGNFLYLANWDNGLEVYSVSETGQLTHIDNDYQGGNARGVWGDGNFLYLANWDNGLEVYSVSETGQLTHIDNDYQGGNARGVWGDGNFLYLANNTNGLEVYSVSETGQLTHIDNDDQGGDAFGVWGDGNFLYLANNTNGLEVYQRAD